MPFLTQGKTNWKYILIVLVLAVIVGGGILWWAGQEIPLPETPEIKSPENKYLLDEKYCEKEEDCVSETTIKMDCINRVAYLKLGAPVQQQILTLKCRCINNQCMAIKDETANWKTYRNEEYGFEFEYPKDWGDIIFKSQKSNEVYTFDSPNETIEAILYHKPSGVIAFIMRGEKYEPVYGGENYQDILKIIYPDKETKTIYTVSPEMTKWYGKIGSINISPNGKYIVFILSAYESSEPIMINIETGKNIFEGLSIWFNDPDESIYWSPNNEVLAIESEINEFAGLGICGIFVSDYGDPVKLNEVFSNPWEKHLQGIHMGTVQFIDNERISFEIGKEIEKYIYNARTKELKRTK
jgi:hypothetical protein